MQTEEYTEEDMADVGRALLEAIKNHAPQGWSPMDCPSEIVGDLRNELDELKTECASLRKDAERYRFLRDEDEWGEDSGKHSFAALAESTLGEFDTIVDVRMESKNDFNVENGFVCSNIGVNGTTPFYFMKHGIEDYEARCGIALLGKTNMTDEQFAACGHNPFHPDFRDNFCVGKGKDELGAIADLKEKMIETSDSLFL